MTAFLYHRSSIIRPLSSMRFLCCSVLGTVHRTDEPRPQFTTTSYVLQQRGIRSYSAPGRFCMDQSQTTQNLDGSTTEYTDITLLPGRLERLLRELFERHWREIVFGPCIQGAVFEIQLTEPPKKLAMLDGYLTVDVGPWHF